MIRHQELLGRVPDIPRWVEPRALLLWDECDVVSSTSAAVVLRDRGSGDVFVIGSAEAEAIAAAAARAGRSSFLVAPREEAARVSSWLGRAPRRVLLFVLRDASQLPRSEHHVALVSRSAIDAADIPAPLRGDLQAGLQHSAIAASFAGDRPVAFCYAGAVTESLWDVAIDTLEPFRGRGHAAACAAFMIRRMLREGRRPVWAAMEDNPPSWRLARKLGFDEVDELSLVDLGGGGDS